MPDLLVAAHVGGDAAALEEALGRGVGEAHHDVLADQRMRHAVVMAVTVGMIVEADFALSTRRIRTALTVTGASPAGPSPRTPLRRYRADFL